MQIINQNVQTDDKGNIHVDIPTEFPETDFELVVVLQPVNKAIEYDDELSEEEISMIEERLEEYRKSPGRGKSWDEVREEIMKKHGL